MQKSIISWTKETWNPVSGCSVVSDGCKFCYAAALSKRYGWTTKPWTIQNEDENVQIKPHKLKEPYVLKEPTRIFVNSMSDLFHRSIPDWYRAVVFCVMLDLPQHTFQVLTKRADATVDWHERFKKAVLSQEFVDFRNQVKDKRVKIALEKGAMIWKDYSPWASHIWMGTSVEDSRVLDRIQQLRQSKAKVRFISAEPLIGAWGKVDLTGIHWVIVGGESGAHMTSPDNPRWMKQEWAREIRDLCEQQSIAFFFKQDSGVRTEMRTYLVEEDGSKWKYEQYPCELTPAVNIETGATKEPAKLYNGYKQPLPDTDWGHSEEFIPMADNPVPPPEDKTNWPEVFENFENAPTKPVPPPKPTKLVSFRDVKDHWKNEAWDSDEYVYIGRFNDLYKLPDSPWRNDKKIQKDTPENRKAAIELYRRDITIRLQTGLDKRLNLELLRGKTLVCWCKDQNDPKPCHGDVLLELLGEKPAPKPEAYVTTQPEPKQMTLFDMPEPVKHRYD